MNALLWIVAVVLVVIGLVGAVVPILPGAVLVFAGLVVAAWADEFAHVGGWTIALLAGLTALTYAVDLAAGALGAGRLGASRRAVMGAFAGTLIGLFFGLPGLILGPFVGAVAGEYTVRRRLAEAGRIGAGTWLGLALGAAAKAALLFTMLGVFLAAYLLGS